MFLKPLLLRNFEASHKNNYPDFKFHLCSPAAIRYAWCCSLYHDLDITTSAWLIDVCHNALGLEKFFKKFYGRYQDLVDKLQRSVKEMVNYLFSG